MKKLIENLNLNINSWLINCGLTKGHLRDDQIETTKFGIFNQWFHIIICVINLIKSAILLIHPKESQMAHLLGDWTPFFGSKIIMNSVVILSMIYNLNCIALFHFSSKHPKMMLWLKYLEFDPVNRCFKKLDLNQSDLMTFTKRITLFKISLNCIICSLLPLFEVTNFICVYIYRSNYHFNYIISIVLICPSAYLAVNCLFCLLIVLYQVND